MSWRLRVRNQSAIQDQPIIFNAPDSAKAGDLIYVQGYNFGDEGEVRLNGSPLSTVKKVNDLLVAEIPPASTGALSITVHNGTRSSAPVIVNRALAFHLNCTEIHPSGAFRIFGRMLKLAGYTAMATVDGLPCTVDQDASHEHMLVCTAPAGITTNAAAVVTVDNGNGSGSHTLEGSYTVSTTGSGDPQGLGVGWGAVFAGYAESAIGGIVADDATNNTTALQSAINAASAGTILTLPSGIIRITNVTLKAGIILKGAGKLLTVLKHSGQYGIIAADSQQMGVRDLTLRTNGTELQGLLLAASLRVFCKNVKFDYAAPQMSFLHGNTNFALVDCDMAQDDASGNMGCWYLGHGRGLVVTGNSITWCKGSALILSWTSDAYVAGLSLYRNMAYQSTTDNVLHGITYDHAHRVYIGDNNFDVINGPLTDFNQSWGEMILNEGGGGGTPRERTGLVASATATTLVQQGNFDFDPNPFATGLPKNQLVFIIAGKGFGQVREVTGMATTQLTIGTPWDVIPDATSQYVTSPTCYKVTVRNNVIRGNKMGIWLYQVCSNQVDIVGNDLDTSIYLRAQHQTDNEKLTPQWNIRIAENQMATAVGGPNAACPALVNVLDQTAGAGSPGSADIRGTLFLGLTYRDMVVAASVRPNAPETGYVDHAGREGMWCSIKFERGLGGDSTLPAILAPIFQRCHNVNQNAEFRLGSGIVGGIIKEKTATNCGSIQNETISPYTSNADYEVIA